MNFSDALTQAGLTNIVVQTGFRLPLGEHVMAPLMGIGFLAK